MAKESSIRSYLIGLYWVLAGSLRRRQKRETEIRKSMDIDDLYKKLESDLIKHVAESFFPGGWYKGLWARDGMHIVRGLIAIRKCFLQLRYKPFGRARR